MTLPGKRARGTQTGRPIMVALDLLGRRWALRVIWELRGGPLSFRALREACGTISPSVLNQRLKDLREARIVSHDGDGYALTAEGAALIEALAPLHGWAATWAGGFEED